MRSLIIVFVPAIKISRNEKVQLKSEAIGTSRLSLEKVEASQSQKNICLICP